MRKLALGSGEEKICRSKLLGNCLGGPGGKRHRASKMGSSRRSESQEEEERGDFKGIPPETKGVKYKRLRIGKVSGRG